MNSYEREEARRSLKTKKLLKTPEGRSIYESAKKRAVEEKRRREILDNYLPNGCYNPSVQEEKPREKTAEEMRMENILKNYK